MSVVRVSGVWVVDLGCLGFVRRKGSGSLCYSYSSSDAAEAHLHSLNAEIKGQPEAKSRSITLLASPVHGDVRWCFR